MESKLEEQPGSCYSYMGKNDNTIIASILLNMYDALGTIIKALRTLSVNSYDNPRR